MQQLTPLAHFHYGPRSLPISRFRGWLPWNIVNDRQQPSPSSCKSPVRSGGRATEVKVRVGLQEPSPHRQNADPDSIRGLLTVAFHILNPSLAGLIYASPTRGGRLTTRDKDATGVERMEVCVPEFWNVALMQLDELVCTPYIVCNCLNDKFKLEYGF